MSDVIPQCITCKYNPCKWYNAKQREKINISIEKCKYYALKSEFKDLMR